MSSVIRVSAGDTLHIRTGVVQGIGPQGPTGPTGLTGEGLQGPQGIPGPTGLVTEMATDVRALPQSLAVDTNQLVTFDSVIVDEFNAQKSLTAFQPGVGNFYVTLYAKITQPVSGLATGPRVVRILRGINGGSVVTLTAESATAASGVDTEMSLTTGVRITDPAEVLMVQAYENDMSGLSLVIEARLWLTRTGPGPRGITGETGARGAVGAIGAGVKGDSGTVGNNTTTFAELEAGTG